MPIAEANAVGRPVVTSNFAPMTEVVADAAFLVGPCSPASIRAGVERIMQKPDYREALVTNGFRNTQQFKLEMVAHQYAELYPQIAK